MPAGFAPTSGVSTDVSAHDARTADDGPDGGCAVSVIIVNWNTREMTLECLRALYAQTTANRFEVLLVDNGSHDGSAAAIAAEFPQVRLFAEATNHGFAVANNIAAEHARGTRLLLLNSDTVVLDHAVDRLVAFADSRPRAGIWGGRTLFGDRSLNITSCWQRQTLWSVVCFAFGLTKLFPNSNFFNPEGLTAWKRDSIREVDIVTGCFLLIDTALWRKLAGFDPIFFMYGEEADLCARARALGARPVITPEATIVHYGGGSATTRSDPMVRLLRAKIALARRSMGRNAAASVRWLYLFAVVLRSVGYGLAVRLGRSGATAQARMWHETLARRGEWFSRASLLVQA
jgi:GT2 family glycosyltransferase